MSAAAEPGPGGDLDGDLGGEERLRALVAREPLPRLRSLAAAHPAPVYLVGGALRDALLGRRAGDIDLVVAGELEAFLDALAGAAGRRPAPVDDRWRNTHRFRWRGRQVDVAETLGSLEEDLRRRDFAVNAMALPLPPSRPLLTALRDPHGGRGDLQARRIRCHCPASLDEDPLRLLRAVRYLAVLEGFRIEADTDRQIRRRAATLSRVAPERVQREWRELLGSPGWLRGLESAAALGLLHPSLGPVGGLIGARAWDARDEGVGGREQGTAEALVVARLAALLWDHQAARQEAAGGAEEIARELGLRRWPASVARRAARAAVWGRAATTADEESLVGWALRDRRAAELAADLAAAVAGFEARRPSSNVERLGLFARRAGEERWVTGADLRSWGMAEGPQVGGLLRELAAGQLQRRWKGREEARSWARGRVEDGESGGAQSSFPRQLPA